MLTLLICTNSAEEFYLSTLSFEKVLLLLERDAFYSSDVRSFLFEGEDLKKFYFLISSSFKLLSSFII